MLLLLLFKCDLLYSEPKMENNNFVDETPPLPLALNRATVKII